LIAEPPRLTNSCRVRLKASTTSVLVPPAAPGSYVRSGGACTLMAAVGLHSWLRTSLLPP
jgi:hypothetical protein